MPLILADRVRDTTTTTGTGTVTLSGTAPTGYQNFSVIGNGNTTYYTINAGSQWEVGIGTYSSTGPTLSRDTVLESSNANALVNFVAGVKDVFVTYPSDRAVTTDGVETLTNKTINGSNNTITNVSLTTGVTGTLPIISGGTGATTASAARTSLDVPSSTGSGASGTWGINITGNSATVSSITSGQVTTALGYTPVNRAGDTMTGALTLSNAPLIFSFSGALPYMDLQQSGVSGGRNYRIRSGIEGVANGGFSIRDLTSGTNPFFIAADGAVVASVDIRAPIYYDSNDTAYYIDPTSNSHLRELRIGTSAGATNQTGIIKEAGTAFGLGLFTWGDVAPIQIGGGSVTFAKEGGAGISVTSVGDFRAPIYYDSNNTAYYIDASSASWVEVLNALGHVQSYGPFYARGDYFVLNTAQNGWNTVIQRNNGNDWVVYGGDSVRAPIFYDSNNTGFYVDPASGTRLGGQLEVLGGRSLSYATSSGGLNIQGDAGGWAMGLQFLGSSGTNYGGFGAYGGGNSFVYHYIGSTFNNASLYIYPSGYAEASASLRAPIFYDSNNTGYFLDPASTSVLGQINFGDSTKFIRGGASGQIILGAGSASDAYIQVGGSYYPIWNSGNFTPGNYMPISGGTFTGSVFFNSPVGNSGFVAGTGDGATTSVYNIALSGWNGMAFYNPTVGGAFPNAVSGVVDFRNGTLSMLGDLRAPIFYDLNNTGYYVNPNGTSLLNTVGVDSLLNLSSGAPLFISSASAAYQRVDGRNSGSDARAHWYGVTTSGATSNFRHAWYDGSAYFDITAAGGQIFFERSGGATINANGDFRAPIFYDTNNTAFYLDPANISVTNVVRANNIQFPNGNTAIQLTNSSYNILHDPTGSIRLYLGGADPANYYDNDSHFFRNRANTVMAQITGSGVFAPIFYDLNNTAFFVDPAGTSVTNIVRANTIQHSSGATAIALDGPTWTQFCDPNGATKLWLGGASDPNNYYNAGIHYFRNTSSATTMTIDASGIVVATAQMRAPIFYDSNNTAFYLDPASTSVLNTLTLASGSVLGSEALFNNMNQPHTTYGDANNVGFGFRYLQSGSNYPGIPGATQYYGMTLGLGSDYAFSSFASQFYWPRASLGGLPYPSVRFRESGTWGAWSKIYAGWADAPSGSTFAASGDFRAPIYYDSNNTAYFLDASGNSRFSSFDVDTTSRFFGGGSSAAGLAFENQGTFARLAFYDLDFWDWNVGGSIFRLDSFASSSTSFRAPIFYDSNNTAYYTDPASTSVMNGCVFVGSITVGSGQTSSDIFMSDSDEGTRRIHCNSNRIGFLTQADGWGSFCNDDGSWQSDNAVLAPIFYDSNNTGYYLDLTGYSQVNGNGSVNGSSGVGLNIFATSGNGAIMAFHRGGFFAVNMGLDSDNVFRIGGWSAGANRLQMDMSGNLTMAGNVTAYSDVRLKKDIETIGGALDLVSKMRGVRYTRIDTENRNVGVIAQEMLEVLPEVVQQGVGDDDTLSVAYGNLVGVLIEAIKELTARVAELEGK